MPSCHGGPWLEYQKEGDGVMSRGFRSPRDTSSSVRVIDQTNVDSVSSDQCKFKKESLKGFDNKIVMEETTT